MAITFIKIRRTHLCTFLVPFHVLFLTRGGAIQCIAIAIGPRKYSYDLLQGMRACELPCMY